MVYPADYGDTSGYRYSDPDAHLYPRLPYEDSDDLQCASTRAPTVPRFRGVNIGGFLVLEPWITPTLFYQFLGTPERYGADAPKHTAMDMYGFCEVLGAEEGNRQLRAHWQAWLTEEDIRSLKARGIDSLRVPVADWMVAPYPPFDGCTDGSLDELDRLVEYAGAHGLRVVLDIHGVAGSQNSWDGSGRLRNISYYDGGSRFAKHWLAEWVGPYDQEQGVYTAINWTSIERTIDAIRIFTDRYKDNPTVVGFGPLNEPHWFTPMGPLQRFYWEAYLVVMRRAPHWVFMVDGTFRLSDAAWHGFMLGCEGAMVDMHLYIAWFSPPKGKDVWTQACRWGDDIRSYLSRGDTLPLVVGEWSLATDNCAMWINGFNDGWPPEGCRYEPCAQPYIDGQPGAPPDPSKGLQGPMANELCSPIFGTCPVDKPYENDEEVMLNFARTQLNSWEHVADGGWFFWNFKTESHVKWDYLRATSAGWLPMDAQQARWATEDACDFYQSRKNLMTAVLLSCGLALAIAALAAWECMRMRARRARMTGEVQLASPAAYGSGKQTPVASAANTPKQASQSGHGTGAARDAQQMM